MNFFELTKQDKTSQARLGVIHTAHGDVHTPTFLPIGTRGSVKGVTAAELKFWGAEMILANTYHLWLRPTDTLIRGAGGLHKFIGWDDPIFTDSGGFQVFSLGEKSAARVQQKEADPRPISGIKKYEKGVEFRDHIDGTKHVLTPEISIQIQSNLGSDIALVLDDVPALPASEDRIAKSLALTLAWAERAKRHFQKISQSGSNPGQKIYGIVQGGDYENLRIQCVKALQKLAFDGYAIGGLAVGETAETMYKVLSYTTPHLEDEKPRHLLGVGYPEQILKAVMYGCDTFDCVIPTRNARHGQLFINKKTGDYEVINILNKKYTDDFTPVDNTCNCYGCLRHNRAYIRHLFMSQEPLALRLASMHNLRFYLNFMEKIRRAIEYDNLAELAQAYL